MTSDGKIVVGQVIPFSDLDAVWYYDDDDDCPRRLLTTVGEIQFISSIAKCKRVADVTRFNTVKQKVVYDASMDVLWRSLIASRT